MVRWTRRTLLAQLLALLGRQQGQHLRFEAGVQQRAVGNRLAQFARRGTGAGFVELRRGAEGAQRFVRLALRLRLAALPGRGVMHDREQLVLLGFAQVQSMQVPEQAEAARTMWGTCLRRPWWGRPIQARYTGPGSTETLISETLITETAISRTLISETMFTGIVIGETALRAIARCTAAKRPLAGGGIGTRSGTCLRIGLAGRKNGVGAGGGDAGSQQRCRRGMTSQTARKWHVSHPCWFRNAILIVRLVN